MPGKMHADEVDTDPSLVSRLLADQFPQWRIFPSSLSNHPVPTMRSTGWAGTWPCVCPASPAAPDHRQGAALVAELAPLLPVAIPEPLAKGSPGQGYPWHWSVHRWVAGESVNVERLADPVGLAQDLGGFVTALRRIDTADGPMPGRTDRAACRWPGGTSNT